MRTQTSQVPLTWMSARGRGRFWRVTITDRGWLGNSVATIAVPW